MSNFKIGEILVGQNFINHTHRNGMECEIIGALMYRYWRNDAGISGEGLAYRVRWADGAVTAQTPIYLRRRRPPQSDSNERAFMDRIRELADKAPQRQREPA